MIDNTDNRVSREIESCERKQHSVQRVVIPATRLKSGQVIIRFGKEQRRTTLYKKKNGSYVYWSPFTHERVVIRRPIKRSWVARSIRELEARLENQENARKGQAGITPTSGTAGNA